MPKTTICVGFGKINRYGWAYNCYSFLSFFETNNVISSTLYHANDRRGSTRVILGESS